MVSFRSLVCTIAIELISWSETRTQRLGQTLEAARLTCERTESWRVGAAKKLTDHMRNVAVMRAGLNTTCRDVAGSPRLSAGDGDGIASLGPIYAQCLGIRRLLGLLCWPRSSRDRWICKYILSRTKMTAGGPLVSVPGYIFGAFWGEKGGPKKKGNLRAKKAALWLLIMTQWEVLNLGCTEMILVILTFA